MIRPLHGVIGDKFRAMFTTDQILHKPPRNDSKPMPKTGVQGIPLGKVGRKGTRQ